MQINPCPFCKTTTKRNGATIWVCYAADDNAMKVICSSCGACGPSITFLDGLERDKKSAELKAIMLWNSAKEKP